MGFGSRLGQYPIVSSSAQCENHSRPVLDVSLSPLHELYSHAMWDTAIEIWLAHIGQISWAFTSPGSRPESMIFPHGEWSNIWYFLTPLAPPPPPDVVIFLCEPCLLMQFLEPLLKIATSHSASFFIWYHYAIAENYSGVE